tara:strand:- start:1605 stop:2021 length:417 start_codon:yes stop_codon:yes gene_type:complete
MNDYFYTHFDRVWDELQRGFEPPAIRKHSNVNLPSYPPCDCLVSEDRNKLLLKFAMAGYSKDDVTVTATEGHITIKASCKPGDESMMLVHHGISSKAVDSTIAIDERFNAKKANVKFVDGMLWVEVPTKEEAKAVTLM